MIATLGVALSVVAFALLVPTLVLALEVAAAVRRTRDRGDASAAPGAAPRLAVLMPAHDEAAGIGGSLATVVPQLEPGDRVVVVADNCSDRTAAVASAAGAQVVERTDRSRRGKGYALDFGVRFLERDPPEVVVIVDADCSVAPGSLRSLARASASAARPAQALYLMHAPPSAGLRGQIAEFAWLVKNHVRPLGAQRLGWPCQLMGSGMAFPWRLLATAPLASAHLVEDVELGLALAAAGSPPFFCPEALVTSIFPGDAPTASTQRTRWEHGHLAMIASRVPALLAQALRRRRGDLAAIALDIAVPPLSLLVLLIVATFVLSIALLALGGSALPAALALAALLVLAAAIVAAWRGFARALLPARSLRAVPRYVLAKLPIYWRAMHKRQSEWVRTKRDDRAR